MDKISQIEEMHQTYCKLTGLDPMARENSIRWYERSYWEYLKEGFTPAEWELVLKYLQKQNREMRGFQYRLKPSKLLGDMQIFCEHLADAKRWESRRKKPNGAQQALNEFRGYKAPQDAGPLAKPIRDVLLKLSTQNES